MQTKNWAYINLGLAAANALLGIINGKWYLIAAAVFMALIAIAGAVKYLSKDSYENLRSFSWYSIIAGLSILSLAISTFYGLPRLGFLQVIISIAMTLIGCYTLLLAVKEGKVEIIP